MLFCHLFLSSRLNRGEMDTSELCLLSSITIEERSQHLKKMVQLEPQLFFNTFMIPLRLTLSRGLNIYIAFKSHLEQQS